MRAHVDPWRSIGYRGQRIGMHRAFRRMQLTAMSLACAFSLVVFFVVAYVEAYPMLVDFWQSFMALWFKHIGVDAEVFRLPLRWGGLKLDRLAIDLSTAPLTRDLWLIHATTVIGVWLLTKCLPAHWLPISYAVRIACLMHAATLAFFLFLESAFPYSVADHTRDLFSFNAFFLLLIPLVLALTYYILEASWWRKLLATALIMAYFILAIPVQMVAHALIAKWLSPMMLALLYLALGPLLNLLVFVALYSWVVTWRAASMEFHKL